MSSPFDMQKFRTLIYNETGMLFDEKKDYYLTSRIEQRMKEARIPTVAEYYQTLMLGNTRDEFQKFVEAITINETYMFRDFPQLQGFAEKIFPAHVESKLKKKDKTMRVWSAACSTGEEAYTLAIILKEMLTGHGDWQINVIATDIDTKVLDIAKKGVYGARSMKDTPLAYRQKYFIAEDKDSFSAGPLLRNIIKFHQLNFMDKEEMRKMRNFDFIFCRNVLIYFDDNSRKKVVEQLYESLVPNGHLFLGHSESIGRITDFFETQTIQSFMSYRKPLR